MFRLIFTTFFFIKIIKKYLLINNKENDDDDDDDEEDGNDNKQYVFLRVTCKLNCGLWRIYCELQVATAQSESWTFNEPKIVKQLHLSGQSAVYDALCAVHDFPIDV